MNDYLYHTARGTSWKKKSARYEKKVKDRYYYDYEAEYKKLWKLKKKAENSDNYKKAKAEYDAKRAERANNYKAENYRSVADSYRSVANVHERLGNLEGASRIRTKANLIDRRANDISPKHTKPNKFVNELSDSYNKTKMVAHKKMREVTKDTINKGKALISKLLKRK